LTNFSQNEVAAALSEAGKKEFICK